MSDPTTTQDPPAPPSVPPGFKEDDTPPCPDPNATPDEHPPSVPGFDPQEWAERQKSLREQAMMQGQPEVDEFGLEPPGQVYPDELTDAVMSRFHLEIRNTRAQNRIRELQAQNGAMGAELRRMYATYEPDKLPPEWRDKKAGASGDNAKGDLAKPNSKSGNVSQLSERSNGRHEPGTKA